MHASTPPPAEMLSELRATLDAHAATALSDYVDMAWRWIRHLEGDGSMQPAYPVAMVLSGLARSTQE